MLRNFVAVFLGGLLGVSSRALFDLLFTVQFFSFSYISVMIINALGCFALGALTAGIWSKKAKFPRARLFIGPGFLGGFTTFSGVMLQTVINPQPVWAAVYLAASLATSMFGALLGFWLGAKLVGNRKVRA